MMLVGEPDRLEIANLSYRHRALVVDEYHTHSCHVVKEEGRDLVLASGCSEDGWSAGRFLFLLDCCLGLCQSLGQHPVCFLYHHLEHHLSHRLVVRPGVHCDDMMPRH